MQYADGGKCAKQLANNRFLLLLACVSQAQTNNTVCRAEEPPQIDLTAGLRSENRGFGEFSTYGQLPGHVYEFAQNGRFAFA